MLDIGWTELLVIGIVALIVVGPKDLPAMFRTLGRFTAKMKGMAREFQRAMDEAADDSGMRDTAKDLRKMTSSRQLGLDRLKDAADRFDKWEPGKDGRKTGSETDRLREERAAQAARVRETTAEEPEIEAAAEDAADAADAADLPAEDKRDNT
ncbi:sec-independent protein translocase protein TatB [Tranquillimonas rosea]|uniref:Sec-independent protein translocase protein TatB n=1 Tax=Tranquillimonas rosea TaxID=641238 RepID=A0A1H9V2Z9_9RHOB|nr:Sec-independent protein translocase protein TatB [Tranquillimonas rosea]SES16085.1 sec-independent protein translocase protein TatB [Tranquillimonas rosea]